MQIVRGKQAAPVRAVIYGPEGIGKSTLAAAFPEPLFVDLESGTLRLDVARVQPKSFGAVEQIVAELTRDPAEFRTLVFDTADWLERQLIEALLAEHNWKSIETPGYGKGWVMLAERFKSFLDAVAAMQQATGLHVVFCAHSWLRKQELPDESGAFDRWELKLGKHTAPALKEWADLVLFANYRTIVVTTDGKAKAQGQERVLYATHHACWDAKNRFGLPDCMPMVAKALAPMFADVQAQVQTKPVPAQTKQDPGKPVQTKPAPPADDCPPDLKPAPKPEDADPEKAKLLKQLAELMNGSRIVLAELDAYLAEKGIVPAGTNPRAYNLPTLKRVVAGWTAVAHNIEIRRQPVAAE